MPQCQSEAVGETLETLAKSHFKREFTEAEHRLLANVRHGKFAYCGPSQGNNDPNNDPSKAHKSPGNPGWEDREIAADLIRWLCVEPRAKEHVDPNGIMIHAAEITGELNLDFVSVPFPLRLWNCALTQDVMLNQVDIARLDLQGSWTKSLVADGASVKGGAFLREGFRADGEVRLLGARIGGNLDCAGGAFMNHGGDALSADRVNVNGNVFLNKRGDRRFQADGAVRL